MATKKNDAAPAATGTGRTYKTKKVLTVPVLKMALETPVHVRILDKMFVGKAQTPSADSKQKAMEPATLVNVVNLDTGEANQLILGAALQGTLIDNYPKDGYVGLAFRIVKHDKAPGKKYNTYTVEEIESE